MTPQGQAWREARVAFVSGLEGTSKWEVFCVLSSLPLCLLIAAFAEAWVAARARSGLPGKLSLQLPGVLLALPQLAYEVALVVVPQLLLLMSLAPAEPAFLLAFLLWGILALKLWMKLAHSPAAKVHMAHALAHLSAPRKRYVSAFRGGVMLVTCLAILAVDFAAFPRRYAKAEGYGGGVMDLGVGAIVWAGGLASTAAAAAAAAAAVGGEPGPCSASSGSCSGRGNMAACWLGRLGKGVRAALPLLALAGARWAATSLVGYQLHVGEYGSHWNFFASIAATSVATRLLPMPPALLPLAGLVVAACHQALLAWDLGLQPGGSLRGWIQAPLSEADRAAGSWWTANKEGLGSLPGYWALHLLGAGVGHHLSSSWARTASAARSCLAAASKVGPAGKPHHHHAGSSGPARAAVLECGRQVWAWIGAWFVLDALVWAAMLAVESGVERVSRRSCNLAYVLWTCAQCLAWLLLCVIADLLTSMLAGSSGSGSSVIRLVRGAETPSSPAKPLPALARGNLARSAAARRLSSGGSPTAAAAAALGSSAGSGAESGTSCEGSPRQQHKPAGQAMPAGSQQQPGTPSGTPIKQRRSSLHQQQAASEAVAAAAVPLAAAPSSGSSSSCGPLRLAVAFNRNMLPLFLIANLLTGAINLAIDTLAMPAWPARAIVGAYMLFLCLLAVFLDRRGLTLRLAR